MTTKQLPPPWGRVGVGAANKPRSDKTTAPSPTKRLPPPWDWNSSRVVRERVGVGAANTPRSNKTLKTPPSPFTYTLSAQVYVNNPIGCALAHRLPDPTTIAQTAAQLPPPLWDWNSSRAVRERVGAGGAAIPPSPCGQALTEKATASFVGTGGGDGGGVRPHTSLINREPAVGWVSAQRVTQQLLPSHTANCSLPLWGRVGVGAANKPRSGKTPKTTPSSFIYTLSAQAYVKSPIACALAHRHLPPPPATGRIP